MKLFKNNIFNSKYLYKILTLNLKPLSIMECTWKGVPISETYGNLSPWEVSEFPPIVPAYNHAVLYHVRHNGAPRSDRPPIPQRGQDKWDKDFVRMPYSNQSLYPVEEENGATDLKKRWQIIEEALCKPIRNSSELAETIISYNTKFKNQWSFAALHKLFNECLDEDESEYFFSNTLPEIVKLALSLPQLIQSPIPLLKQHKNKSISLTQQQISSLLANAFFCTFPRRNTTKKTSEYASYPYINFNSLYEYSSSPSVLEKLKCICHYFRRVTTKVPTGVMTFMRRTVEPSKCPRWPVSETLIGSIPVHINSSGTIEDDGLGLIQVDFANKYLGGGVLSHGCVQEEIRFVICPELLVSMLFTEVLKPTEALLMLGCERYSDYAGYASSFQWAGNHVDKTPRDSSGRIRCAVLAIDALPLASKRIQYKPTHILREMNKAWVGVSAFTDESNLGLNYPGVATGNWGCGAFGGSPDLKFLLQLLACAQARRPIAYYTFGDTQLRDTLMEVYQFLSVNNITVGDLFKYLVGFFKSEVPGSQLYSFIYQAHNDKITKAKSNRAPNEESKLVCEDLEDGNPVQEDAVQDDKIKPNVEDSGSPKNKAPPPENASTNQSPDIFATDSEQTSTQSDDKREKFVDLEKGEGCLHVNIDTPEVTNTKESSKVETQTKVIANEKAQTSALFHHMTLLDEENSDLNLHSNSACNVRLMNEDGNENEVIACGVNDDERMDECEDSGPAKKMAKKITDYFAKKF